MNLQQRQIFASSSQVGSGFTWDENTSIANTALLQKVLFANDLWVAVGNAGNIFTATDAKGTWTSQTISTAYNFYSVAYGNGLWVAVGNNGTNDIIYTSPDAATWTARSFPSTIKSRSIAFANGIFVCAGTGIATSPDGITWTVRTNPVTTPTMYGIAYGNGVWVVVGDSASVSGGCYSSDNGATWTNCSSMGINRAYYDVVFDGTYFRACQQDSLNYTNFTYSSDGSTWTNQQFLFVRSPTGLAYANGRLVAICPNFVLLCKKLNVKAEVFKSGFTYGSVAFGQNRFVAVGPTSKVAYSLR
jgi:hypothetical protein